MAWTWRGVAWRVVSESIESDAPCAPRHNAIVGNFYCNLVAGFIDRDNATITGWGSTMWGNVEGCPAAE